MRSGDGLASIGAVTSAEYTAYRDRNRSLKALAAWSRYNVPLENDRSSVVKVLSGFL